MQTKRKADVPENSSSGFHHSKLFDMFIFLLSEKNRDSLVRHYVSKITNAIVSVVVSFHVKTVMALAKFEM